MANVTVLNRPYILVGLNKCVFDILTKVLDTVCADLFYIISFGELFMIIRINILFNILHNLC